MKKILLLCLLCASPAFAQVPDLRSVAQRIFDSRPADVVLLRQLCDQTEALRAQFGQYDPRVEDGVMRVDAIKGMFTRRIAYAVHQLDPRFGLRRKDIGAHAIRPGDGIWLATDALLWRDGGQVIDVMSDRNPSWGVNPGDLQPLNQWVEPLPEADDVPAPPPVVIPPVIVPPTPAPSSTVDYSGVLQQILESQRLLLDTQHQLLSISTDTNTHVVSMDRTLTQTLGSLSKFLGKYVAPAIGGYFLAKQLQTPATVKP